MILLSSYIGTYKQEVHSAKVHFPLNVTKNENYLKNSSLINLIRVWGYLLMSPFFYVEKIQINQIFQLNENYQRSR